MCGERMRFDHTSPRTPDGCFEKSAEAPPLPQTPEDVFVEYCFPNRAPAWGKNDTLDGSKTSGITMRADHMSMRWVGSPLRVELLYTFPSPEQAAEAEAAQRVRCAQRSCNVTQASLEGRVVRYVL